MYFSVRRYVFVMTNEPYNSSAMLKLRILLFVRHGIVALFIGDFLGWSTLEDDDMKINLLTSKDNSEEQEAVQKGLYLNMFAPGVEGADLNLRTEDIDSKMAELRQVLSFLKKTWRVDV